MDTWPGQHGTYAHILVSGIDQETERAYFLDHHCHVLECSEENERLAFRSAFPTDLDGQLGLAPLEGNQKCEHKK